MPVHSSTPLSSTNFCARRSAVRLFALYLFLMSLSLRPSKRFTISDQRVPISATAWAIMMSSIVVHFDFLIWGARWLCQRSRHCLPVRPGTLLAISVQVFVPMLSTTPTSIRSSSAFHGRRMDILLAVDPSGPTLCSEV